MKMLFRCLFFIVLSTLCGCGNNNEKSSENIQETAKPVETSELIGLNSYWKTYQFTSKEVNDSPDKIEQSFVDYLVQFPNYSIADINESLKYLITKSEQDSTFFLLLKEMFTNYLYHPNSPMRNEQYYEQVLMTYQESSLLSDSEKERDKIILDLVHKNQVGNKAANFQFENLDGSINSLESYNAILKLLIFYDPSCLHCNDVITQMRNSEVLNSMIHANKIKVIAVDPLDDYDAWKKYSKNIPLDWINGFDRFQRVIRKSIYNLQAYPTIYLINTDNVVVMKDVYLFDLEKYLLNLN